MSDANAAYAGGERALPIAVMKRRHDLVKLLLDFKADPNAKDKDGFTDLMLACKEKKEEAAALLTDATKNAAALDVQDTKYKRSALHYANSSGLESIVAKLLGGARGARIFEPFFS